MNEPLTLNVKFLHPETEMSEVQSWESDNYKDFMDALRGYLSNSFYTYALVNYGTRPLILMRRELWLVDKFTREKFPHALVQEPELTAKSRERITEWLEAPSKEERSLRGRQEAVVDEYRRQDYEGKIPEGYSLPQDALEHIAEELLHHNVTNIKDFDFSRYLEKKETAR